MEDFLAWLLKLSPTAGLFALGIVLIIVLILKSKTIVEILKWFSSKKTGRSCGDCVLILFGIREKYETETINISNNILRSQMSYFEQKAHELILSFIRSYQEDLELLGANKPASLRLSQFGNYQEALKNAMAAVKDEVRKAFKENGFVDMSESEYSSYVKSKVKTLISIVISYLSTFYIQTDEMVVTLKYRVDKIDTHKIDEMAFDVFGFAKTIVRQSREEGKKLKDKFKNEIDDFIKNSGSH